MTKLTKNLSRKEFACKCGCGFSTVDYELAIVCQDLADHFQDVIYINSGCRCKNHNKSVHGTINSKHLLGIAADVRLKHKTPRQLYKIISKMIRDKKIKEGGLGLYKGFVHYDTRGTKARWNKTNIPIW